MEVYEPFRMVPFTSGKIGEQVKLDSIQELLYIVSNSSMNSTTKKVLKAMRRTYTITLMCFLIHFKGAFLAGTI